MKTLFLLFIITLFCGCKKEFVDSIKWDGNYSGIMSYTYNNTPVKFSMNRSIVGNTTTWYTSPPITSEFISTGNSYPIVYAVLDSDTCQNYIWKWEFIYTGQGTMQNDSLFENGTYDAKYYTRSFKGDFVLKIHTMGIWKAKFGRTTTWYPLKK